MPPDEPVLRRAPGALLLLGLAAGPAVACEGAAPPRLDPFAPPFAAVTDPERGRPPRPLRRVGPPVPGPAIVTGYLPRNPNIPMYNEPPGTRASGGPSW